MYRLRSKGSSSKRSTFLSPRGLGDAPEGALRRSARPRPLGWRALRGGPAANRPRDWDAIRGRPAGSRGPGNRASAERDLTCSKRGSSRLRWCGLQEGLLRRPGKSPPAMKHKTELKKGLTRKVSVDGAAGSRVPRSPRMKNPPGSGSTPARGTRRSPNLPVRKRAGDEMGGPFGLCLAPCSGRPN